MADTQHHKTELERLNRILQEKEAEKKRLQHRERVLERELDSARAIRQKTADVPAKIKRFVRATGAYVLGRRNRKQLYSRTYKQKKAHNQLKQYRYHLYELGFTHRALRDIEKCFEETKDPFLRRAAAWTLALWHADKHTAEGAHQALGYLSEAAGGRQPEQSLRSAAIIAAECLQLLGYRGSARQCLLDRIAAGVHPDLYLAMANLEPSLARRAEWINRSLVMHGISPVTFEGATYEDLTTVPAGQKMLDGPKVSVIMPAYNAAGGIGTGIEAILDQTWQNIELLIVDDCSPDDTLEVAGQYAQKDGRVKILSTPVNSGPYVARNIALEAAEGAFVTINDADDWSHAQKIETQVRHLMAHEHVIANTSAHARLTEDLQLHRRGTPGTYIFPNMSSLMFRRAPIMAHVGGWDPIRFAADSEFKKRIAAIFGDPSVVDLNSGPLSFPRQASGSLTGNSAFGYAGFLMGVRKEYAEVHRKYHQEAASLYHPLSCQAPLYPVPEPMWIQREQKTKGFRDFDVVIISDFRMPAKNHEQTLQEIRENKHRGLRTGLVQMARYDFSMSKEIDDSVRKMIDGTDVQMLVYGENISADVLLVKHPAVFAEKQIYVPSVKATVVRGVIDEVPANMRHCARNASEYTGKQIKWYPEGEDIRAKVNERHIRLSTENWQDYASHLEDWIIPGSRTE